MRIFLIGFMGSGKTHWGKVWADVHEIPFYDLDQIIEKSEGKSVLDIFEKNGEKYFRFKESIALRTMTAYDNCIIACGGGAACFDENIDWMNENGLTIYLHASPTELLENIMKEKDKRPLLNKVNEAELLFFIQKKLEERIHFYEQAKLRLRVEELNEESLRRVVSSPLK
ncbi:MAG: shikimate kinase [Ferruginibacter sp.]